MRPGPSPVCPAGSEQAVQPEGEFARVGHRQNHLAHDLIRQYRIGVGAVVVVPLGGEGEGLTVLALLALHDAVDDAVIVLAVADNVPHLELVRVGTPDNDHIAHLDGGLHAAGGHRHRRHRQQSQEEGDQQGQKQQKYRHSHPGGGARLAFLGPAPGGGGHGFGFRHEIFPFLP